MTIVLKQSRADELDWIEDESVDCAATSFPYFSLRKYHGKQKVKWSSVSYSPMLLSGGAMSEIVIPEMECDLGYEDTIEAFVGHVVSICREVKRVLKSTGVFWQVWGDSYSGSGGAGGDYNEGGGRHGQPKFKGTGKRMKKFPPANRLMIPQRILLALQADGWNVRSIPIWAKAVSFNSKGYSGAVMPESMKGWRWERCKIKNTVGKQQYENMIKMEMEASGLPRARVAKDLQPKRPQLTTNCPGCDKCNDNNGYILRKGQWRPTSAYEFIFMLTKSNSYYCDGEMVKEPLAASTIQRLSQKTFWEQTGGEKDYGGNRSARKTIENMKQNKLSGRNPRDVFSVEDDNNALLEYLKEYFPDAYQSALEKRVVDAWTINTKGSKLKHYAAYPERLIEPMIKASVSGKGNCDKCGMPYSRIIEKGESLNYGEGIERKRADAPGAVVSQSSTFRTGTVQQYYSDGWKQSCDCAESKPIKPVVFDPFIGSGTTAIVARKLGCNAIGSDISEDYLKIAKARIDGNEKSLVEQKSILALPLFEIEKEIEDDDLW